MRANGTAAVINLVAALIALASPLRNRNKKR